MKLKPHFILCRKKGNGCLTGDPSIAMHGLDNAECITLAFSQNRPVTSGRPVKGPRCSPGGRRALIANYNLDTSTHAHGPPLTTTTSTTVMAPPCVHTGSGCRGVAKCVVPVIVVVKTEPQSPNEPLSRRLVLAQQARPFVW